MLNIINNQSLKPYNTLGIDVNTSHFISLNSGKDVHEFIENYKKIAQPIYFLGSGANTFFTQNFNGTIVHLHTKGINILSEDSQKVRIAVKAGEIWDDFVTFAIKNRYYGIENLVAIPGTVGAAPIQNIGAYGAEAKDTISRVHFLDLRTKTIKILQNKDCGFGYRNSIFKNDLKGQFMIIEVEFELSKIPKVDCTYGSIEQELSSRNISNPNIENISDIIREIRDSKIPNIQTLGNAGSFFKNPIISKFKHQSLLKIYPEIPTYPMNDNEVKIAAGWLIDKAGLKGFQIGGAAVHEHQALVLINKKNATASDLFSLSNHIQKSIFEKFEIELNPEVVFV